MAKFDMLGITTANMAESFRFYALLGWDTSSLNPEDDYQEIKLESGFRVSWNAIEMVKQIDAEWVAPIGHRTGMAFLCDSREDVDATYQRVIDAGFASKAEPWDAFWDQRYAQVIDPDGNVVDLFF